MILNTILICCLAVLFFIIITLNIKLNHKLKLDEETKEANQQLENFNKELSKKCEDLNKNKESLLIDTNRLYAKRDGVKSEIATLEKAVEKIQKHQRELTSTAEETAKNLNKQVSAAFANYCSVLDNEYQKKDAEYDNLIKNLEDAYSSKQDECMREMDEIRADLEKIRNTRAAAIQANIREKEIKDKLSFYCLQINEADQGDIATLEAIKPRLSKPRILSMLIWQTYYQKPLKALAANILGGESKTGIYKITNINNDMCYIGQAVNIATRWAEHAKCGLGIDTPARNKLYQAMKEDGLQSFSWELLEECPREQLDEKEKYYIDLYQADDFGYNSTKGNTR